MAVKLDLDTIAAWEEKLAIRRSAVLFITVWMSWRAFAWAGEYAHALGAAGNESLLAAAAVIAAVTAPITYLQAAVFKAYIGSKGSPS